MPRFRGPRRRFETKGRPRGIWIVDDYGHHPTEVAAVLRAAQASAEGDVWVVFQPHTTNRTAALLAEFGGSFADADHVLVLPIYLPSGRESAARAVTSTDLVERIKAAGRADVVEVGAFETAVEVVGKRAKPGDLVLTMGAGNVTRLSDMLVEALA
jgi:UDP-N-acetylmuramate--alanine ligase